MSIDSLHGLLVLDAATPVAGPPTATVTGDHGAEVIKVERAAHADPRAKGVI